VAVLTKEKEDDGAWVRNRLGDGKIRHSGWPNGGGGFQVVLSQCFKLWRGGGELTDKREAKGKTWQRSTAYNASGERRRKEEGGGVRSVTTIRAQRPQAVWR
jgi:hypothetical protein